MLRRLRGRFGISAPRVAVRTHIPWYWRGLAVILISAAALALAGWVYDAGRRFAGFDSSLSAQEVAKLRDRSLELESELVRLRSVADASESRLQIEQASLRQMAQQVSGLEQENLRLKEDLAAFESLAQGEGKAGGVVLSRLRVEPTSTAGEFRYVLLAGLTGVRNAPEFKGLLKLLLTVDRGGQDAIIEVPSANEASLPQYQVTIRYFRKLDGTFSLPPQSRLKSAEARLIQGGVVKASQRILL